MFRQKQISTCFPINSQFKKDEVSDHILIHSGSADWRWQESAIRNNCGVIL